MFISLFWKCEGWNDRNLGQSHIIESEMKDRKLKQPTDANGTRHTFLQVPKSWYFTFSVINPENIDKCTEQTIPLYATH